MRIIQHNCHLKGTVVHSVLETGIARKAAVVLMQEPPIEEVERRGGERKVYRLSHPGYEIYRGNRAWTAVKRDCVRNPKWRVERRTDLEEEGEGDVVILDITPPGCERLRIINVYDQAPRSRSTYRRPARQLDWDQLIAPRTILAGDFNAHSPVWNARCRERVDAGFLEQLIVKHDLVVWNDDQATFHREGCDNHSIIDLTITTPDLPLAEWALDDDADATESDHRMIVFELALKPGRDESQATSQVITGWKIEEMGEDEHLAAEEEWRRRAAGRPLITPSMSPETIEAEAEWLSETTCAVLNIHAKPKRICARSKRWWSAEIGEKRRILGSLKRMRRRSPQLVSAQEVKTARRELRRTIRKAKRECWQGFLQEAQGEQVWQALRYTSPRMDSTTQALKGEHGETAATIAEKEELIVRSAFPTPPPDEPVIIPSTGSIAEPTDAEIERAVWSPSIRKAPGPDCLNFAAVRLVWRWDRLRLCALIKACIVCGIHPSKWKIAKGVVLRKPDKPDYSKVKAYRVIALLNCLGKVAEKVVANKLSDLVERRDLLHQGQFGSRKGRSAIDAVAVLMNRTQEAWKRREITAVLLMDVKGVERDVRASAEVERYR
jgi:hypothetical protein